MYIYYIINSSKRPKDGQLLVQLKTNKKLLIKTFRSCDLHQLQQLEQLCGFLI